MKHLIPTTLAIDTDDIQDILEPIFTIIGTVVPVLLLLLGSIGSIWCIVLGVKYAKAEDPQEHEKAKKALINAIVGFVLIFVLLIMLELAVPIFTEFWQSYLTA